MAGVNEGLDGSDSENDPIVLDIPVYFEPSIQAQLQGPPSSHGESIRAADMDVDIVAVKKEQSSSFDVSSGTAASDKRRGSVQPTKGKGRGKIISFQLDSEEEVLDEKVGVDDIPSSTSAFVDYQLFWLQFPLRPPHTSYFDCGNVPEPESLDTSPKTNTKPSSSRPSLTQGGRSKGVAVNPLKVVSTKAAEASESDLKEVAMKAEDDNSAVAKRPNLVVKVARPAIQLHAKPGAQVVQIQVPLETHSPTYDTLQGELFGSARRGSSEPADASQPLDHILLTSDRLPKHSGGGTTYMVGAIQNGELHLTPIDAVMSFRPSLDYIDELDKQSRAAKRAAEHEDSGSEAEDGVSAAVLAAQSASAKKQSLQKKQDSSAESPSERRRIARQREIEEEEWMTMQAFAFQSKEAQQIRETLLGGGKLQSSVEGE